MNSSGTPTGENGLKVTKSNDVKELWDNYFKELDMEGYRGINFNALTFDLPKVSIKGKDADKEQANLTGVINVISTGKVDIAKNILDEFLKAPLRSVAIEKLKARKARLENAGNAKEETSKNPDR